VTSPAPVRSEPWLQARGIRKVYDGTVALDGVDFDVTPGLVHVLVGENGAGKSTLMKVLAGIEAPSEGHLRLGGREVRLRGSRDAAAQGIGIIHQELLLCPNLSVRENLFLGRERTRRFRLDAAGEAEIAREILGRLEHPIDPRTPVGDLSLGQQQVVEIAKALTFDLRMLIMDEPTSALSAREVDVLFRVIRELAARGVAIVYISHRLDELLAMGHTITVLRDGRVVGDALMSEVDVGWIVERMVGRSSALLDREAHLIGQELLRVESLSTAANGHVALQGLDFSLRAGEILGVYGLLGAGRTELVEALAGARPVASGHIRLGGVSIENESVGRRIARGLILVPEDRQREGVVPTLSVGHNLALASVGSHTRFGRVRQAEERAALEGEVQRLRVKAPGLGHPITALSGGNQQKVVIGRALLTRPRVLLLDEPARGIDVAAKAEIFGLMRALAREGLGIVFVSSEVKEVLALSDRVLVLSRGRITAQLRGEEATADALFAASGGGAPGR
jgi:erythritol transport system ATP-binding protein